MIEILIRYCIYLCKATSERHRIAEPGSVSKGGGGKDRPIEGIARAEVKEFERAWRGFRSKVLV